MRPHLGVPQLDDGEAVGLEPGPPGIVGHAVDMRLVPFPDATQHALDKVRGALTASAQRELLGHLKQLQFVGIPAQLVARPITRAVEEAWFTQRPLDIAYRNSSGELTKRTVRIEALVMERTLTFLNCFDASKNEKRQFRLDRIESAELASPEQLLSASPPRS